MSEKRGRVKRVRRAVTVGLPEHVFQIKKPGKVYYYHQPGRKKPKGERGALTRIHYSPDDPEFWIEAARLNGRPKAGAEDGRILPGSFEALIAAYQASPHWNDVHTEGTRRTYGTYLKVILAAWKRQLVDDLTVAGVIAMRNELAATAPSAANMMVTVLKALLAWGINNGECTKNVARDIKPIDTDVEHAFPWPVDVWTKTVKSAPTDVSRLAFLGRVTGQRISDLIRLRPADLKGDLFHIQIRKLRGKLHRLPVAPADLKVIRSWGVGDMTPFLTRANGKRHSEKTMRKALADWLDAAGFKEAEGEEIRPHGLRAMACCDARLKGLDHDDVAALFCMSPGLVKRYTHHIDREAEARNARSKMERPAQTRPPHGAN